MSASNDGPSVADLVEAASRGAEAERQRLAKILHDTVCQSLTGVYFQALVLVSSMKLRSPEEASLVGELANMIHGSVVELGDITRGLKAAESPLNRAETPPEQDLD